MSDSDEDSETSNIYRFQNDNMTITARGPKLNNTNISGLSFRNNGLTSPKPKPVNLDRQRYGGLNCDQRNMSYRRGTSPMSLRSVPDYRPGRNQSVYHNGMGTQRLMYNGRGGSPKSVCSNDTMTSISSADIAFAFKNAKYNKYDLRVIKDAYNKMMKNRQRKRIEKRRKLKLFFKGTRRKSGEDSGTLASDSSISSDDCRSVRTTICKENIPDSKQINHRDMNHITNVSHFTNNIRENSMFTDRTENIKRNTLRNMLSINSTVPNFNTKERFNLTTSQEKNISAVKAQNTSTMTQKERFTRGFLWPSQRFNKTISGQTQLNNNKTISEQTQLNNNKNTEQRNMIESSKSSVESSGSDQEEIFRRFTVSQKDTQNVPRKRSLENEDICQSNKKRNNSDSPKKLQSSEPPACNNIANGKCNDFIFAKPKMLVKKGKSKKDHIPEKLLAKSRVPPIAEEIFEQSSKKTIENNNNKDVEDTQTDITHNNDTSMRPSFIKRKLFTQKLDVAEQKNVSSDNSGVNSPQNIYSASMRERNKARKLVTSQSCLSREVTGEDNNVLDLIHKIVTPDQINSTHIANKTECNNKSNNVENSDKWDVTAIIANCDNQDISDTYTDEEIFDVNHEKKIEESKKSVQNSKKKPHCMDNGTRKKTVTDCVKSFWDTDFESETDFDDAPHLKSNFQQNQETILTKRNKDLEDKQIDNSKKIPMSKNCAKSKLNNRLKSHRTPFFSSSENIVEHNKPNSIVQEKDNKEGRNIKATNLNQDISDTYTDEEIFNVNREKKIEESKKSVQNSKKEPHPKIVIDKLPQKTMNKLLNNNNSSEVSTKSTDKGTRKKTVTDCVKSFWDTDFESETDFDDAPHLKSNFQQNQETILTKRNKDLEDKQINSSKKIPMSKNCAKSILNNSLKSHRTPFFSSSENIVEHNKPNSIVQEKNNKEDRNIKATNLASHTGKKKDSGKENVAVNKKNEEVRRTPKAKQCDCSDKDNPKNSSKNGNKNKVKDIKCGQKNNAKTLKHPVNNRRIQPTRKSKDKSFDQSSTLKAGNSKGSNKTLKPKELVSENTSINNTSIIMTRSRYKLSFNSSQSDSSSVNLSNISNRSLRFRKRVQNNTLT